MFSSFLIKEGICSLSDTTHHKNKNIWITAIFLLIFRQEFFSKADSRDFSTFPKDGLLKIRRKNTQNSCFRVKYGFC